MFVDGITVGPVATNCYLLGDEATKRCALIDPGAQAPDILQMAREDGYTPVMILLTHGHFDHVDGVREVLNLLGSLPVYLHPADYPYAPAGPWSPRGLGELEGIHLYREGDTVTLDGLTIHVLETPGHTAGSVTLQVEDALFTGDTLFSGSCGRTDFETSSQADMLRSLARLARLEGDYRVYPGHEGTSTLAREQQGNPFLRYAVERISG
ncbi:MAG: MBL fold metallo-hydrolase [Clostridiales bacterium]|nr:MBL fold metallo-hydrolase [Clostridiales bacterium]